MGMDGEENSGRPEGQKKKKNADKKPAAAREKKQEGTDGKRGRGRGVRASGGGEWET